MYCYDDVRYSSHAVSCNLYLKTPIDKELIAHFKCDYTVKSENGRRYIEFPENDLHSSLDCFAPSKWSICTTTEQFPKEDRYIIKITFGIYKQPKALRNKEYYDTKVIEFSV